MRKLLFTFAAMQFLIAPNPSEAGFISIMDDSSLSQEFWRSIDQKTRNASKRGTGAIDSRPSASPWWIRQYVAPKERDGGMGEAGGMTAERTQTGPQHSPISAFFASRFLAASPVLLWHLRELPLLFSSPDLEGASPVPRRPMMALR